MPTAIRDVVVIGASVGGVAALSRLTSALPVDFPAAILVVQHIGSRVSRLPEVLSATSALPCLHAQDGQQPDPGKIYVAPPDHHLLLEAGQMRLSRGPKENHTRPAIDPLFRSAALSHGKRVIGIVLTGHLDDGTAGLQAIKRCGGLVLVQDPLQAEASGMPASAIAHVDTDYCGSVGNLAQELIRLAGQPVDQEVVQAPVDLLLEHFTSIGHGSMAENLERIGKPSVLVCPECSGTLWEIAQSDPVRYRCHTGHAYGLGGLADAQTRTAEVAMWSAVRALQDLQRIMQTVASNHLKNGDLVASQSAKTQADQAQGETLRIEQLLKSGKSLPLE